MKDNAVEPQVNNQYLNFLQDSRGVGFAGRDIKVKELEVQKEIKYELVKNDGVFESMRGLIDLKNIFSKQLPKMPKEYICRQVFDRKHESQVIKRCDNERIIGGICFRVNTEQGQNFAEIAFLAITADEQIKGFGTRLMNKLKEEMQKRGVHFLTTYADNLAIGYFKKQGFQKNIQVPREISTGYLKDYDGSTMMECLIDPCVSYSEISGEIKDQKKYIIEYVKSLVNNYTKYDKENITFATEKDKDSNGNPTIEFIEKLPGIYNSRWTKDEYMESLKRPNGTSFKSSCKKILDQLVKHKSSWPFQLPVKKEEVPDYYEIIEYAMDLQTLRDNLNANKYKIKEHFEYDIKQVFINAKTYNLKNTIYYKCANEVEEYANKILASLKEDYTEKIDKADKAEKRKKNK